MSVTPAGRTDGEPRIGFLVGNYFGRVLANIIPRSDGIDSYVLVADNGVRVNSAATKAPKYQTFDMGFPVVFEGEIQFQVEGPVTEFRKYGSKCDNDGQNCKYDKEGDAVIVRLKFTRPVHGFYTIEVSNLLGYFFGGRKPELLKYRMLRHDVGTPILTKEIKVVLAFDTIELIQYKDEPFPRIALTSRDKSGLHVMWERLKDVGMCLSQEGYFLDTKYEKLGDGWCRFSRLETALSGLVLQYISGLKEKEGDDDRAKGDRQIGADFQAIASIQDPVDKLKAMTGVVERVLGRPYQLGEACVEDNCWTYENIVDMVQEGGRLLKGLDEYFRRKRKKL